MLYRTYPATERQTSEWEYAATATNYSSNLFYTTLEDASYEAIESTFNALINRHESLRTTFSWQSGELLQLVHDKNKFPFKVDQVDISTSENPDQILNSLHQKLTTTKLNIETGPLIKAVTVKLSNSKTILAFIIDHIISDAASLEILKREFTLLYNSFKNNRRVEFKELNYQMKDYALWECEYNRGDSGQSNLQYWKQELSNDLIECSISEEVTKVYPPNHDDLDQDGGWYDFFFPATTLKEIKAKYGSESTFITASLFVWLYWATGQSKIIIAAPFSSRDTDQLTEVVGYLMSAMYLRIDLTNATTFCDILDLVITKFSLALEHRHYSRRSLGLNIDRYCTAFLNNRTFITSRSNFNSNLRRNTTTDRKPYYGIGFEINSFGNGWLMSCNFQKKLFSGVDTCKVLEEFNTIISKLLKSNSDVAIRSIVPSV